MSMDIKQELADTISAAVDGRVADFTVHKVRQLAMAAYLRILGQEAALRELGVRYYEARDIGMRANELAMRLLRVLERVQVDSAQLVAFLRDEVTEMHLNAFKQGEKTDGKQKDTHAGAALKQGGDGDFHAEPSTEQRSSGWWDRATRTGTGQGGDGDFHAEPSTEHAPPVGGIGRPVQGQAEREGGESEPGGSAERTGEAGPSGSPRGHVGPSCGCEACARENEKRWSSITGRFPEKPLTT